MKNIPRTLIVSCGIIVAIIPAIYLIVELIHRMDLPIKTNADGSTVYLFMDVFGTAGQPLPTWFMLFWGLIGLFIIIIGVKPSKTRKRDV